MIVDDSQVARAVLSRMLGAFDDFEIVATAGDSEEALRLLPSILVDIVLLDVEMPGESGLEALPEIVRRSCGARVLIVSSFCGGDCDAAVRALAPGTAETLSKPGAEAFAGRFSEVLAERLRRMGRRDSVAAAEPAAAKLGCLAVGASTGGLNAVAALLKALPDPHHPAPSSGLRSVLRAPGGNRFGPDHPDRRGRARASPGRDRARARRCSYRPGAGELEGGREA
jgi:two-component system chemotaxis response regulator CheB